MSFLVDIILPVFGTLGLGYVAARCKMFDEAATRGLSLFVFNFAIPLMLFLAIAQTDLPERIPWGYMLSYYIGAVTVFAGGMLVARFIGRRALDAQGVSGLGASFSNTAMLGIPLVIMAYGEAAALPLFILLTCHSLVLLPPATIFVAAHRGSQQSFARMLGHILQGIAATPIIWGLAGGLLFALAGWKVPGPVESIARGLGGAAVPCALFALGASLVRYRIVGQLAEPLALVALKTLVHPVLVWLLATRVFDVPAAWVPVAVTLAALPAGITPYLFAQRYQVCQPQIATTVFVSTVFSVVSLSLLLFVMRG